MTSELRVVPAARAEDIVTTETNQDLLVYDQRSQHLHSLNAAVATVWRLCDGQRTIDDIVIMADSSAETVQLALEKLSAADLLQDKLATDLRSPGTSRRTALRKAVIAGSLPVIVSVTAPLAAQAVSRTAGGSCIVSDSTCSDVIGCCGQICNQQGGTVISGTLTLCYDLAGSPNFQMNASCICDV